MKELIRSDYLSKENCNCLKAIFAIAIMIAHMFAFHTFGLKFGLGPIVTAFGYLSVSFFLFFSGYGLTISYINKGESYFKDYFRNRILPIYIVNLILIFTYTVFQIVVGYDFSAIQIIKSFFIGGTVVKYGWYIQTIILFYVFYCLAFKNQSVSKGIIRLTVLILLYCIVFVFFKMGSWWYESSFTFVLGAVWAVNKSKIDSFLTDSFKRYFICITALLCAFAVCFVFGNAGFVPIIIKIPVKMISSVLFVLFILLVTMRIKVNYKLIEFLGNYYFEIYILQGIFIILFTEVLIINNIIIFYLACVLCTVFSAILIHPVIVWINKKCKGG